MKIDAYLAIILSIPYINENFEEGPKSEDGDYDLHLLNDDNEFFLSIEINLDGSICIFAVDKFGTSFETNHITTFISLIRKYDRGQITKKVSREFDIVEGEDYAGADIHQLIQVLTDIRDENPNAASMTVSGTETANGEAKVTVMVDVYEDAEVVAARRLEKKNKDITRRIDYLANEIKRLTGQLSA